MPVQIIRKTLLLSTKKFFIKWAKQPKFNKSEQELILCFASLWVGLDSVPQSPVWYQIQVVSGFCPRCNPIARCLLFFQHPAAHCLYLRTGNTINHSSALYWTQLFSVFQPSRAWGSLLRQTTQDSAEKWSAWMQVVGLLLRFLFRPLVLPWWALKSINSFISKPSRL